MDPQIDEQLIGALYGTAVHDGDWRPALERFCELLDSCEASLPIGTGPNFVTVETTGRVLTPEATGRYVEHYGRFDPKQKIFAKNSPGYLFNDARHFDERFVAKDVFYQEYSRSLGTRHTLDMLVERNAKRELYLAAMRPRHAGPYEPGAEALFRQASGHFARALALKEDFDCLREAGDALDSLELGVVVVDLFHRVRLLNSAAERQLVQVGELILSRGILSSRSQVRARQLHALIDAAVSGKPEGGLMNVPKRDGSTVTLRVTPLPASSRIPVRRSPAALILICGEAKSRLDQADLASLYGLTEAESRVAMALADGMTLAAIALRHEVKWATVRTQLLSVMQKMGVHRQADVARLLLTTSAPTT